MDRRPGRPLPSESLRVVRGAALRAVGVGERQVHRVVARALRRCAGPHCRWTGRDRRRRRSRQYPDHRRRLWFAQRHLPPRLHPARPPPGPHRPGERQHRAPRRPPGAPRHDRDTGGPHHRGPALRRPATEGPRHRRPPPRDCPRQRRGGKARSVPPAGAPVDHAVRRLPDSQPRPNGGGRDSGRLPAHHRRRAAMRSAGEGPRGAGVGGRAKGEGAAVRGRPLSPFVRACLIGLVFTLRPSPFALRPVEAAVSSGQDNQLETGLANQGGRLTGSSKFKQQSAVGDAFSSHRLGGSRFRIFPGFLGGDSSSTVVPVNALDLTVLYAKTDAFGQTITPAEWQTDRDPLFIWAPPIAADNVAGYSYAIDGAPDDIADTVATSFNVATATPNTLADGKHTFSVKAIGTGGIAGTPLTLAARADTTPPQVVGREPQPGALFNTPPAVTATISDAPSGGSVPPA